MKKFSLLLLFVFSLPLFAQESEQWCRFRGPNGQGISTVKDLPTAWSSTENIAWKVPISGNGWSSPVVWNDRVFLTMAENDGKDCFVLCLQLKDGISLWKKKVFSQEILMKHPRNSSATPTPATDGKYVYTCFSSGKIATLDFNGDIVWTLDLKYYSHHGFATSPMLYKDKLIIAINPSNPVEPKRLGWQLDWDKSYLLALDKNTGKEIWRGERGMSKIGHSTPIVIQVGGKDQILSPAGSVVQAFDPENGKRLWSVQSEGEPCIPTAAIGDGCVFSGAMQTAPFLCIKTDGKGECSKTHILWEQKRNTPMMASFLYVKPCIYTASDNGGFCAFDEKTGELLWQKRLGEPINPSPIYADGKIYVLSELGTTTVFQIDKDPAKPAKVFSTNNIGEQFVQASFAVAQASGLPPRLLLRTEKELWCIGK